jgi:hypothetical protein
VTSSPAALSSANNFLMSFIIYLIWALSSYRNFMA